ncbi:MULTISPECIES: GntR family transcriptional regulator [unclassified Achromobacter]|uniref:GntR family transcriptional regulator n=1 Tax=unclassified Achromobacter TaxID=2626865 RepID=UPI000B51D601|nr:MULTISPECIES: GntR family transcriptional regulator [unclassified Achromobacter]OWT68166.1 GntR family transcriptional regulator [Achromobacter sp. HZ34]OWT70003.1 GntR family transcriptional regulator [Achromobacter sp. HZ28]
MSQKSVAATHRAPFETDLPDQVRTVIEAIETDIIRGRILPRTRLIEDHLMDDYEAKRHVVRAALVELQRLGVVVKPPHLGAQLRRFDLRELADLYRMRSVLHRAAVAMMPMPLEEERLAALTLAMQVHADAAASGDLIAIHRSNMAFHRELYGLCDNPYLAESIRLHDWLSFPARAYGVADAGALEQACREHADMVDALRTGDRPRLDQLAQLHMERARDIYVGKFLDATAPRRG